MADRYPNYNQPRRPATAISAILHKLQSLAPPHSAQLLGLLALLISGTILLLLTGATVTAAAVGFILFLPIIVITSPIWIPVFILVAGFLSFCGFAVGSVAAVSWLYKYIRGMHPPGSDRVDYARSRIYDTAAHVKDYAREYGGYLQSKVKDAAPGA